jgi:hypothetical protein
MTGELAGGGRCALSVIRNSLRLDWRIRCLCALFLLVLLPTVTRHVENPQMMAAYSNDEPYLAVALDATTRFPWGNPANYFDIRKKASQSIPEYWGSLRYTGITYYGGAMFVLAFPPYAIMRAVGFPAFPTAPILLRLIVVLAGLASLVVLYNVGKERGFAWAGLLAAGYLGTNIFFIFTRRLFIRTRCSCCLGCWPLSPPSCTFATASAPASLHSGCSAASFKRASLERRGLLPPSSLS